MHRPTWVEIDLGAISNNINEIIKFGGNKVKIIAIVKADAYGHGIIEVSNCLVGNGVGIFGVATVEDAVKLRKSGIMKSILLLGCILPEQIDEVLKNSITPTILNYEIAKELSISAGQLIGKRNSEDNPVLVHVKVDTGMGGFGIPFEEAVKTISKINDLEYINIEGIFTHQTSADGSDKNAVMEQINIFKNIVEELESIGIHIQIKHTDNSSIMIQSQSFNTVRPGISLYGLYCTENVPRSLNLHQAMCFKTRIVNIKLVKKGKTIGYSRTYTAERDSLIATLPVGYSDGYRRELSNKGRVLVKGMVAEIVGTIRMDFTYIDVTSIPGVEVGDEVVLFGEQKDKIITIASVAALSNTIPYEITCGIGKDVPRIYV